MMYEAFIFDLDGTLVSHEMDFSFLKEEVTCIIEQLGYDRSKIEWDAGLIDTLKKIHREMNDNGLDGDLAIERARARIYDYELERAPYSQLIPGTIDVLSKLKHKGYKIAIVTRNNRDSAEISIKNAGMEPYIDLLIARGDTPTMKPDPAQFAHVIALLGTTAEKTVVVGDYVHEIEAGNELGCYTIGVLTGTGDKESLSIANEVIESIIALNDLF